MKKQIFYQKDSKGKIREWDIEVVMLNDNLSKIVINAGIKDGKKIKTVTDITEGKNIGKANQTTAYEQAILDAETEIHKKVKAGYVDDIENIKEKNETLTIKKPMKGDKYHPKGLRGGKTLEKLGLKGKDISINKKLDGFRQRIYVNADEVKFYSSGGDLVPSFPQIESSIRKSFDKIKDYIYEKYGVSEYYLDGEIYRHGYDENGNVDTLGGFANVSSACGTKVHITPEKQILRDAMEFHLFDVCMDAPYSTRMKILDYFKSDTVKVIENFIIKADEDIIEQYFEKFLSQGYEGLMLRRLDMPYEYKRTKQLTKYKPVIDDEFKVIGFKRSITGETLGSFECVMENGKTFFANPKDALGSDKIKKEIWDNKEHYIGNYVTVEFLEMTPELPDGTGGVPRHPRAKCFRKGKSID